MEKKICFINKSKDLKVSEHDRKVYPKIKSYKNLVFTGLLLHLTSVFIVIVTITHTCKIFIHFIHQYFISLQLSSEY